MKQLLSKFKGLFFVLLAVLAVGVFSAFNGTESDGEQSNTPVSIMAAQASGAFMETDLGLTTWHPAPTKGNSYHLLIDNNVGTAYLRFISDDGATPINTAALPSGWLYKKISWEAEFVDNNSDPIRYRIVEDGFGHTYFRLN